MCTPPNMRVMFVVLTLLKSLQFLFLFAFSIVLICHIHLHLAYGYQLRRIGWTLLFMTFWILTNAYVGLKGSTHHNKFLLLVHIATEGVATFVQIVLVSRLMTAAEPIFAAGLRYNCVDSESRIEMSTDEEKVCDEYLTHERTKRFRRLWEYYFAKSEDDTVYFAKISNLQIRGQCCGFGLPWGCIDDNDSDCAGNSTMYPSVLPSCNVTGSRCPYEMPLGICVLRNTTKGCAAIVEDVMNDALRIPSLFLCVFLVCQVGAIIVGCCFGWKRRREDTLPKLELVRKNVEGIIVD